MDTCLRVDVGDVPTPPCTGGIGVDLDYLVRHEVESTALDFKAVQYRRHDELLKDLIAMANALVDGPRYIIVGLKVFPSGERDILGIAESEFIDDASYQELVRTNVEPALMFSYTPFKVDGQLLGVFRIGPCDDPPYMMRKDLLSIRHGDTWIRRGTSTSKLTRPDLDRIISKKERSVNFQSGLRVGFNSDFADTITCPYVLFQLPSAKAKQTILAELAKARANPEMLRIGMPRMFGGVGYDGMSIEHLEEALLTVADDYYKWDYYCVVGENCQKLNLTMLNTTDRYLEDVTVELRLPRVQGLAVANTKPQRPNTTWDYIRARGPFSDPEAHLYPQVTFDDDWYTVRQSLGDLRHGIPTQAFHVPIQIALGVALDTKTIELPYSIHAKNLGTPIAGMLRLVVSGVAEATPDTTE